MIINIIFILVAQNDLSPGKKEKNEFLWRLKYFFGNRKT